MSSTFIWAATPTLPAGGKACQKTRDGSNVIKKYDTALTPYRRMLGRKDIDDRTKEELQKQYDGPNPAELKRKIARLQDKLLKLNSLKKTVERNGDIK